MLKQLFWGPSAQVKPHLMTKACNAPHRHQSRSYSMPALGWGFPVSCRSREEVPRGQPHSPCTKNAMLSNLPLYHKYSIIYIRNNIYCEGLKTTSARKANPALPFSRKKTWCSQWIKHHQLSVELEVSNIQVSLYVRKWTHLSVSGILWPKLGRLTESLLEIKNREKKGSFF